MSEQADDKQQEGAAETPVFRLQKMFVKDLSFESPNAPEVFMGDAKDPKVEVNMGLKNKKLAGDDNYEVTFSVTAKITDNKSDKTMFIIEIEHSGIFLIKNVPEQHLSAVLAVECPTLMFPFTRQIISQISVDGGFMPFLMEPVNFLGLFQNSQKQRAEQQKEKSN